MYNYDTCIFWQPCTHKHQIGVLSSFPVKFQATLLEKVPKFGGIITKCNFCFQKLLTAIAREAEIKYNRYVLRSANWNNLENIFFGNASVPNSDVYKQNFKLVWNLNDAELILDTQIKGHLGDVDSPRHTDSFFAHAMQLNVGVLFK